MLKNIRSPKYEKILVDTKNRDTRHTIKGLEEYTEFVLLDHEDEMKALEATIEKSINSESSLKKLKKHFDTDASVEQVNNTLLLGITVNPSTMPELFSIYILAHKLNDQKKLLKRKIVNLKTIINRIQRLDIN